MEQPPASHYVVQTQPLPSIDTFFSNQTSWENSQNAAILHEKLKGKELADVANLIEFMRQHLPTAWDPLHVAGPSAILAHFLAQYRVVVAPPESMPGTSHTPASMHAHTPHNGANVPQLQPWSNFAPNFSVPY